MAAVTGNEGGKTGKAWQELPVVLASWVLLFLALCRQANVVACWFKIFGYVIASVFVLFLGAMERRL